MSTFSKQISIRWADLDPNFHLRHSVYYDLGSQFRMELLEEAGLTMKIMKEKLWKALVPAEINQNDISLKNTI